MNLVERERGIRDVTVIGCGLIGTSAALALRRRGVEVRLCDLRPQAVRDAAGLGAGRPLRDGDPPADVVLIATLPSAVVPVLQDAQRRGLGRVYTDAASAKARILAEAGARGCDLASFVPGHPMAGRELSGPLAARAGLFEGRRWALCPGPDTAPAALATARRLALSCGALPLLVEPGEHDRAVAAVSHVPHLLSSALAARFADADETLRALAGQGLRDVTRLAAGAPALWRDILEQNAGPVASVLEEVARELAAVAAALRRPERPGGRTPPDPLTDLLTRGGAGRAELVGPAEDVRAA